MKKIIEIFKQYKCELLLIYLFMLISELTIISQPYLLGKSIDGLINNNYNWLWLLAGSYLFSTLFIYKGMIYDTKVYTKIYNDIVLKFLKVSKDDLSTKIARTNMAHDIVGVLEGYVHYYISTIITVIGSIGLIYFENWRVGTLVSLALIFISFSVSVFYKKIKQTIILRNTQLEKMTDSIDKGYDDSVNFFNRRRKIEIFNSNLQGKNWFLAILIKNLFLIFAIILLVTTTKNITIGSVITVYSYVNTFLVSLMSIPVTVEMFSRLNDILKRL